MIYSLAYWTLFNSVLKRLVTLQLFHWWQKANWTRVMSEDQMKAIQDSLAMLLTQNKDISDKIDALERENREIKNNAMELQARVEA